MQRTHYQDNTYSREHLPFYSWKHFNKFWQPILSRKLLKELHFNSSKRFHTVSTLSQKNTLDFVGEDVLQRIEEINVSHILLLLTTVGNRSSGRNKGNGK